MARITIPAETDNPLIATEAEDGNTAVLERFDRVGVDVDWCRSTDIPEGQAVTDAEARTWLAAVRSHNPDFRLFLKHC